MNDDIELPEPHYPSLDEVWLRAEAERGPLTAEALRMIVGHFREERAAWLNKQDEKGKTE